MDPSSLAQLCIVYWELIDCLGRFLVVRLQDENNHDVFHLAQGYLSLIYLRLLTALEIQSFFIRNIAEDE